MAASRSLAELVNTVEPGWALVEGWIREATNAIEILAVDREAADRALVAMQVTTRSPMGAIIHATSGILVDHGWVRLLGSAGPRMREDIVGWNAIVTPGAPAELEGACIVAHDALGGVFAIDGGAFGGGQGHVFYFAPDSLEWEDMEGGYSHFVQWCFSGDLAGFYEAYRWPAWRDDVARLTGDQGFSIYPPLWTEEGKDLAAQQRAAVPMRELWHVQLEFLRQLGARTSDDEG